MPFDTTYHIYSGDPNSSATITTLGGSEHVDIYLKSGELPPGMDRSVYVNVDSLINLTGQNYVPAEQKPDGFSPGFIFVFIFVAIFGFIAIRARREAKDYRGESLGTFLNDNDLNDSETAIRRPSILTYYGEELNFSNEEYATILTKHFPYYNSLNEEDKNTFTHRIDNFIKAKVFKIHSSEGFSEMPVLISAAAIQLTFGLKKYLLTNFDYIHIFPQEFMRVQPTICFLEGIVSGHSINLSWKHFLQGIQIPEDGKNVGLHEMAHALYYQTFVTEENVDSNFRDCFNEFNSYGNKVYDKEMATEDGLYSEYAMKNFQEFWAESVEIFFEKPKEMQRIYPNLYLAIADVLNQDPAARLTA